MKVEDLELSPIHTVSSDRSIRYVSEIMNELHIGSLVVADFGSITGIITSRDIRSSHPNRLVADAMTPDPICISAGVFIWDALEVMEQYRIKKLLVMNNDNCIGLITRESIKIGLRELYDPLTGLYRSPYIQMIYEHSLIKQQPYTFIFIDLNGFGEINKRYGHPLGDDIIVGYANLLNSLLEANEFLCRYAGDEFVMLVTDNHERATELEQQLLRTYVIQDVAVSASIGLIRNDSNPEYSNLPFRDIVSKASLLSTYLKKNSTQQ